MNLTGLIITVGIISGQLIKIPLLGSGGLSILDLVIICFCIFGLVEKKFHLVKPPISILSALVFISISTISLVFSPINLMFSEYLISFSYIIRFSLYVLFAWLISQKAFKNFQKEIPSILIFSGLGLAILGILQLIFLPDLRFLNQQGWDPHYFRTVSTFLDPNFAGAYFALTLILLLSHPGGRSETRPKVFVLIFVVTFFALMTTFSRSSYLMFLISGLTLSFLEKSKSLFIKTIILFLVLFLGFQTYTQLVSKPRNIDRGQSASFRFNSWQQGLIIFQKYPVLGAGFNAYKYTVKELKLGDQQFIQSHGSTSNDSSLLFVASTTGILGLISYLFFLMSLIWKTKNYTLIAAILGLLIHSIFSNSLFFSPILLWLLLTSVTPKK